jgi:hypothetical protein
VSQARAASLLLATIIALSAVAFLRVEQLKLDHSPVERPHVKQFFSPTCDPARLLCHPTALLRFTLGSRQAIGLSIVNADGQIVRHLTAGDREHPKGPVRIRWDGRSDSGALVPDGRYRLAVHLANGRTVTIPDPIILDTKPPTVDITRRDRTARGLVLHFITSEPSRTFQRVTEDGRLLKFHDTHRGVSRFLTQHRKPGLYEVAIVAVDPAGNRTANPPVIRVRVR